VAVPLASTEKPTALALEQVAARTGAVVVQVSAAVAAKVGLAQPHSTDAAAGHEMVGGTEVMETVSWHCPLLPDLSVDVQVMTSLSQSQAELTETEPSALTQQHEAELGGQQHEAGRLPWHWSTAEAEMLT